MTYNAVLLGSGTLELEKQKLKLQNSILRVNHGWSRGCLSIRDVNLHTAWLTCICHWGIRGHFPAFSCVSTFSPSFGVSSNHVFEDVVYHLFTVVWYHSGWIPQQNTFFQKGFWPLWHVYACGVFECWRLILCVLSAWECDCSALVFSSSARGSCRSWNSDFITTSLFL